MPESNEDILGTARKVRMKTKAMFFYGLLHIHTLDHEDDGDTNYSLSLCNSTHESGKEINGTRDQKKNWDHPGHSSIKIRILKRDQETQWDLLSLILQQNRSVRTCVKTSQRVKW